MTRRGSRLTAEVLLIVGAAIVMLLVAGRTSAESGGNQRQMQLDRLVIVDGQGRARIRLGTDDEGNARISFLDGAGELVMKLDASDDGSYLVMLRREGRLGLELFSFRDRHNGIGLFGPRGEKRMGLGSTGSIVPDLGEDSGAWIALYGAQGGPNPGIEATLEATPEFAQLELLSKKGGGEISLTTRAQERPRAEIRAGEESLWKVPQAD